MGVKRHCLLAATSLLVGCSTPQTRFADNAPGYQEMCARMGYTGQAAAVCIQNLYANDEQNHARRREAIGALGNAILTRPQPQAPAAPQVCRWIGPNWVCQ